MSRDDLEAAADRAALAAVLDARGRHREALEMLRGVLSTLEQVLGPDHYEVGLTLSDFAEMQLAAGRFGDAHAALTRATTIFERVLGASHPTTVACRDNREKARPGKKCGG